MMEMEEEEREKVSKRRHLLRPPIYDKVDQLEAVMKDLAAAYEELRLRIEHLRKQQEERTRK